MYTVTYSFGASTSGTSYFQFAPQVIDLPALFVTHFGRLPDDAQQAAHMRNVVCGVEPEWRNDPSYFWGGNRGRNPRMVAHRRYDRGDRR